MLKHFKYVKESGDASNRVVYPLYIVDGDKMLSIDVTPFTDAERKEAEEVLTNIHQAYLKMIREAGYADRYRSFFLKQMS